MTNFKQALLDARTAELKESNGKINQTDRNNLRNKLMEALTKDIEGELIAEGGIVEIDHEFWGGLYLEVSVKIKDVEFDLETALQEYHDKVQKAEHKKAEIAKRAAERAEKTAATKKTSK